jgi:putative transposase
MRFALVDGAKAEFPVHRVCRVLGVSQSGYFDWRGRPACRRQRDDMVLLAHVRSAFALSNGTYGSPRMTRELQDSGLTVAPPDGSPDARQRPAGSPETTVQADHSRLASRAEPA